MSKRYHWRGRLQCIVRPRCAPDPRLTQSQLAPGHPRLRDTPGPTHSPAPAHVGDAGQSPHRLAAGDPRPLRTWETPAQGDAGPDTVCGRGRDTSGAPPAPARVPPLTAWLRPPRHRGPCGLGQAPTPGGPPPDRATTRRTRLGHRYRPPQTRSTPGRWADRPPGGRLVGLRQRTPVEADTSRCDGGTATPRPPQDATPDTDHAGKALRCQREVLQP